MAEEQEKLSRSAFLDRVGRYRFAEALEHATRFVRGDPRFVGLDKVRRPIADTAALHALGGDWFQCSVLRQDNVAGLPIDEELRAFLDAATVYTKEQIKL